MTARVFALPLIGLLILGSAADAQHGDSAQADVVKQLVGAWRLASFNDRLADGTIKPDPRSVGYIVYTDAGRMCATLMDP